MNTAEWIIMVILAVTLFIFLVVGIIFLIKIIGLADEAKKITVKGQDIADNANGIVSNIKGMTAIGGTIQALVDKYVEPKLKVNEKKSEEKTEEKETKKKAKEN